MSAVRKEYINNTYAPKYIPEIETLPSKKLKTRKRVKSKAVSVDKNLILFLFTVALFSIMLLVTLRLGERTADINNSVNLKNAEIKSLESEIMKLDAKLESLKNAEKIEYEASTKLGMIHPTEEQIIYVKSADNSDAGIENENLNERDAKTTKNEK